MHPSVREGFHRFSEPLEGRLPFMYLCTAGEVTTAIGVMMPTASSAVAYPWRRKDGSLAGASEVVAEWERMKALQHMRFAGGGAFGKKATLFLEWDDVDRLTDAKLLVMERHLGRLFPAWDLWPADGQLALLSWAWAVGPAAKYPRMISLLKDGHFAEAAYECTINPQKGTIVERNERNRVLLRNAQFVRDKHLDPRMLYWPTQLTTPEDDTLPELPVVGPVDPEETVVVTVPLIESFETRRAMTTEAVVGEVRRSSEELALDLEKLGEGD